MATGDIIANHEAFILTHAFAFDDCL